MMVLISKLTAEVCSVNIVIACILKELISMQPFIVSAGFHAVSPYRPGLFPLSLCWLPLS